MKKLMFACAATLGLLVACQNDDGENSHIPKTYQPIELTEVQTRMPSGSLKWPMKY